MAWVAHRWVFVVFSKQWFLKCVFWAWRVFFLKGNGEFPPLNASQKGCTVLGLRTAETRLDSKRFTPRWVVDILNPGMNSVHIAPCSTHILGTRATLPQHLQIGDSFISLVSFCILYCAEFVEFGKGSRDPRHVMWRSCHVLFRG